MTRKFSYWCWRMIVISSGYCSRMRVDSRTPGRVGAEGHVEMMVAGQLALAGDVAEHPLDNAAERLLDEKIVADQVVRHSQSGACGG